MLSTIRQSEELPLTMTEAGKRSLTFDAQPGLYLFSVIVDAGAFDWESLYLNLTLFGNKGQRTGPWDFNLLEKNSPLVPSYWVSLDGRRIGLWFFERMSIEDIEHKRFRGKMAFEVREAGTHRLELGPFRTMAIGWMSARLEVDPDDRLVPLDAPTCPQPLAAWQTESFWAARRREMETTHAAYRQPLKRAFDYVMAKTKSEAGDLELLIAAHGLDGRAGALDRALDLIDKIVAAPAWSNSNPAGYSHNGDMGAAFTFHALALAYHALDHRLGDERRARLLAKMALQGEIFVELALLNRDYWGGSLVQDHGWNALFAFGAGALMMRGILPQAEHWAAYALPRIDRALAAMPRDGVIPATSWLQLELHVDYATHYRNALLAATGRDIFDNESFHRIPAYVEAVLRDEEMVLLEPGYGDRHRFCGGHHFLNILAFKYRDATAARLQRQLIGLDLSEFYHSRQRDGYYSGALWGFLSFDPSVTPAPAKPRRHLLHYEDARMIHYRDDAIGVTVTMRSVPILSRSGYARSHTCCDRLSGVPGAGHFVLILDGVPLLTSPEAGYRLNSFMTSVLLIDDHGQIGDVGYPMSIPSFPEITEEVEHVRWDAAPRRGSLRLNLKPVYPEKLGVVAYTREFEFTGRREILLRDRILLDRPRKLSWLFQGKRETGVRLDPPAAVFGRGPEVRLTPRALGAELAASVHETDIVWSYASTGGFKAYDHVCYDSTAPSRSAAVEFAFTWEADPSEPPSRS